MEITHVTAPTQYVEVGAVSYAYRSFGAATGVPLVFFQHFRGGLDNWDPAVIDGLAHGRPVILFNNAGIASSTGMPAETIAESAAHAFKFLCALKLTEVDLFGFSTGGFTAQQLASDHPQLVRRLVLAGTGPQGGEDMADYKPGVLEHATSDIPTEDDILYLFFASSKASQSAGRAFWARRHARANQDCPTSAMAMEAQAKAIGSWGTVPATGRYRYLETLSQPVLVVNGHNDIMVPTINSYILQQHLPNATLLLFPDSGHGAIFQYHEIFVAQAARFLDA